MNRIVVLPIYGIGDALMSTPALRNIKEQMDVEITYLHMFKTTLDILEHNPYIDCNCYFPFLTSSKYDGLRFLSKFRKRFDYSINFFPSNRKDYNLAAFFINSPERLGHRYVFRDRMELNFLKNRTVIEDDRLHNVEENLRLLDLLHVKNRTLYPLEIFLQQEEHAFADTWLKERNVNDQLLVGIHPGTSLFKNHARKRWPEASFVELVKRLAHDINDVNFLLFGGPEEKSLREKIIAASPFRGRVISVDTATIRQAASVMKRCFIFISNDSGPMHMAAALRVPIVAIFGPTNPVWVRPWGVPHRVVQLDLPCSPCFHYSPNPLRCSAGLDFACLRDISVERVYEACCDLNKELQQDRFLA